MNGSTTTCPACGSGDTTPAFTLPDLALRAATGTFSYRRCTRCGSVFAAPAPDPETLARAYAAGYGNYQPERSLVERIAEPLVRREARRLLGRAPAGAPLLEIGCGTGRFLERVRAVGYDGPLRGLEYSPDVAAATAERLGIPVEAGDVEDADLRRDEYGAIVLRHVIEHVRDPAEVVGRLHAALRPGGVLYLGTPDVRALSAQAFGRYWWGWEVPRHLVVFSAPALRALLERTGFEIEAEWAGFAPQMWNASLSLWLDRGGRRPRTPLATHLLNPVVTGPACVAAGLEVATGRSTMYAVLARRPLATMGRDA